MKKVKFLIVFLALVLAFQWSGASPSYSNANNRTKSIGETTLKQNPSKNVNRPNAPSRSYIQCMYGESFIEFVIPDEVESMSVRIYNGVDEYAGTVTADTPWIELPNMSGIYDIECTTDDGRIFSGLIEW